jgi:hypothetical protein
MAVSVSRRPRLECGRKMIVILLLVAARNSMFISIRYIQYLAHVHVDLSASSLG